MLALASARNQCAVTTDSKSRRTASTAFRESLGLGRPETGWWHWWRDPHFLLAALAAAPGLFVLGQAAGDRMHVDFAATALISLAVVQPVVEELAFRGALQGYLLDRGWTRRTGPVSIANLGTTVAFVALHFIAQPPAWALAIAAPSLVFGHVRERLGTVLPAIALHSHYNAGFAATAWWMHR